MKINIVRSSFANKMFVSVLGIFLLMALLFMVFQYQRETEYRVDILNNRLQVINYQAETAWPDTLRLLPPSCRLTVLDLKGEVLYDNVVSVAGMGNHLDRREVQRALKNGSGYDIQRNSEFTGEKFFYSATLFNDKGIIVRSALPYNSQLYKDLNIDKTFVFFVLAITAVLCIVLYRIARHLAMSERQKVEDEKHRLKRQLTQNAAHELKTPTASISAYLETMLENADLPDETRRHFLERSYAQCNRMTNILSDMSALAKMDEVQQVREPLRINIKELLGGIADDVRIALEKAKMTLVIDIPSEITVMGDRSLVYSIFRNLIDNAIAYAAGDTCKEIKITVSGHRLNESEAEFIVSDNGIGVPAEHLPHLCERFYRIDKGRSRKIGGTGLGLAIVKNAVLLHGGTINLMPTPAGGLTVRFTLPAS